MVCLNENISFNINSLKKELILEMKKLISFSFNTLLEEEKVNLSNNEKVTFLEEKIENKVTSLFHNDNFIYLTMNNKHCSFKHQRGNNEGYFCSKKIRTNLEGQKKDYLCCLHSKKHIPKKRKEKKKNNHTTYDQVIPSVKNVEPFLEDKKEEKEKPNIELLEFAPPKLNNSNIPRLNKYNKYKSNTNIINVRDPYNYNNIYKRFIINENGTYKTLIKEIPLLDFCINKIKNIKNKKYINYNNLL